MDFKNRLYRVYLIPHPECVSYIGTKFVLCSSIVSYNKCVGGDRKNTSPIKAKGTIRCIASKDCIMNRAILLSVAVAVVAGTVTVHVPVQATFRLVGNTCVCAHNVNHLGKKPSTPEECAKVAVNHVVLGRPVEWFIINPVDGTCNIRNSKSDPGSCADMMCGQFWSRK